MPVSTQLLPAGGKTSTKEDSSGVRERCRAERYVTVIFVLSKDGSDKTSGFVFVFCAGEQCFEGLKKSRFYRPRNGSGETDEASKMNPGNPTAFHERTLRPCLQEQTTLVWLTN